MTAHGATRMRTRLRVDSPATPADLAALTASLYTGAPPFRRWVMTHRPYICPFERLLDAVPQGSSVLDVGCGSGLFLGLLAATGRNPRGLGFDTSAAAVAAARAMTDRLEAMKIRASLRFEQRDAGSPWPDDRFSVVSLIDVLHHVRPAQQEAVVAAARDAVEPGGILLYKDIGPRPAWRATANRMHDAVMAREWVHYRPAAEVMAWARSLGLRLLRAERINRLWYGHDLLVLQRPATLPSRTRLPHQRGDVPRHSSAADQTAA